MDATNGAVRTRNWSAVCTLSVEVLMGLSAYAVSTFEALRMCFVYIWTWVSQ
jgi:hypothetical protein